VQRVAPVGRKTSKLASE